MFVTLTNAAQGFEGTELAINSESVVSVYQIIDDNDSTKFSTFLYTNQGQTFQVKESVHEVSQRFNAA